MIDLRIARLPEFRAAFSRFRHVAARGALGVALGVALAGCNATNASFSAISDRVDSVGSYFHKDPGQTQQVAMFIASTRHKAGETPAEVVARFSLQNVSIPPGHKPGEIEQPRFGAPDPANDFVVTRRRSLEPESFRAELASHISGRVGNSRDILLYVHGFNTSLEEARFRLAQIVADGGFTGVPVLFTWQSKGDLFAYESDKEAATASRDALERLLLDLAHTPGVGRVQILAHSMGAWLTMEALRETAIAGHPDLDGKLGSIMLAAPDIDLGVFRQQVARLDPSRISVFVSHDDRALSLSSRIAGSRARLGAMDPSRSSDAAAIDALGVHVYDLSLLSGSGWVGHDTYANVPAAVRQIGATLTKKRADSEVQAVIDAGGRPIVSPPPSPPTPVTPAAAPAIPTPGPANAPIVGEALPPPK